MSRGVDDVYFYIFVIYGGIFGKDCNSAFFFKRIAVHHSFLYMFIFTKESALFKHYVYQCRFSVIYVSYNSYIPYFILFSNHLLIYIYLLNCLFKACIIIKICFFCDYFCDRNNISSCQGTYSYPLLLRIHQS